MTQGRGVGDVRLGQLLAEEPRAVGRSFVLKPCQGELDLMPDPVPPLQGLMGVFLRSQRGREFMVQVPGSATSKLGDTQLAEVLNWCIENFSASSLINGDYLPYTAEEVGRLRQSPLQEIDNTRAEVLAEIARLPESGEISW